MVAGSGHPASAANIRAQLRVPLWNDVRSYFSFGECTRSSSSAKPTMIVSMPSTRLKSPTIGIEPPSPIASAFLPHSAASAERVLVSAGLSNGQLGRRRAGEALELDLGVGGEPRAHEGVEGVADFLRVLRADQAERHLRGGLPGITVFAPSPV